MIRNLETRVTRLEQFRKPHRQYVFHVSDPLTFEEKEAIANAVGPIVIVPHPCKIVEEWIAKHAPKETLQ